MNKKAAIALVSTFGIYAVMKSQCASAMPAEMPEENRVLSQREQQTLKEIIDEIERDVPVITTSAVLSTAFANPARVSEKQKKGFAEQEFILPYNIRVGALVKISDIHAPYIISTHGFLSDKESHAVRNFLSVTQKYLQTYNMVILDHPTSSAFVAANRQPGFGGIEEGYILKNVAKQIKAEGASSVHLFGVSMGGLGVLHAAFQGKGTIDSVLSISGVTEPLDIPATALQAVTPDGECGETYWSLSRFNTAIGLHSLLQPLLDVVHTFPEYKNASSADICDFFFKTKRYDNNEYMKELYALYIERKILPDRLPESTIEYLAQSNASLIAPYIEIPVFLVHAADDPAVSPAHYYNFMLAAKENDLVQGMLLQNGGHNGFTAAYGKKWVACVIKTYSDYWSKEDFVADESCF